MPEPLAYEPARNVRTRRFRRVALTMGALVLTAFALAGLGFIQPIYTEGCWTDLQLGDPEARVDKVLWAFVKEPHTGAAPTNVAALRYERYRFYGPGGTEDIFAGFDEAGRLVVATLP